MIVTKSKCVTIHCHGDELTFPDNTDALNGDLNFKTSNTPMKQCFHPEWRGLLSMGLYDLVHTHLDITCPAYKTLYCELSRQGCKEL